MGVTSGPDLVPAFSIKQPFVWNRDFVSGPKNQPAEPILPGARLLKVRGKDAEVVFGPPLKQKVKVAVAFIRPQLAARRDNSGDFRRKLPHQGHIDEFIAMNDVVGRRGGICVDLAAKCVFKLL